MPLRVRDVATVGLGKELRSGAATQNGREVVMSTVFMLVGANSGEVASAVANKLERVKASLPDGITATAVYDRTSRVDKTLATVQKNLREGALLVVVVLFLLLDDAILQGALTRLRPGLMTALVWHLALSPPRLARVRQTAIGNRDAMSRRAEPERGVSARVQSV